MCDMSIIKFPACRKYFSLLTSIKNRSRIDCKPCVIITIRESFLDIWTMWKILSLFSLRGALTIKTFLYV